MRYSKKVKFTTTIILSAVMGILSMPANALAQTKTLEVDLIWESLSYTPPFYKGKALYPHQGEIIFVAMPNMIINGVRISPSQLTYTWKDRGEVMGSLSGLGKNSLTLKGSVITRTLDISVTVTAPDGNSAYKSIRVAPRSPALILYEDNPMYGIMYQNAILDTFVMKNKELRLLAAPYYVSTVIPNTDPFVSYDWSINGAQINSTENNKDSVLLVRPDDTPIRSNVSVEMKNPKQILQYTESAVLITHN